tara:strand:- start:585 stop:962 length:378 start_codon:yes stop_codon:yes gene_type:complete
MLVLSAIIISVIPAILIAYPIIKKIASSVSTPDDESSLQADLERRWESALEGIRHAELEMSVGNIDEPDYQWLKQVHMAEAAMVLKALEISIEDEKSLIEKISKATAIISPKSSLEVDYEKDESD